VNAVHMYRIIAGVLSFDPPRHAHLECKFQGAHVGIGYFNQLDGAVHELAGWCGRSDQGGQSFLLKAP